tara:strand:- start:68 stop:976 length:909 start_codon:yes stop_codon:yes gene_type:complete
MPAPLVPIIIAGANIVRMVAPTVARALTRSGLARKASQSAVKKAGDKIPKATQSQVEKLARQGTERKNLQNLNRAQKLDKQSKGESAIQTLRRAEKQEKAASGARRKLTPRQEAARLKELNRRQQRQEKKAEKPKPPKQPVTPKTPKQPNKSKNLVKPVVAGTATTAGVGGLASLNKKKKEDKKLKPVPEVNVRTLPKPKKVRSAPKKGDNEELNINPKRQKPAKVKKSKEADDGYRFYGKKGTGLGDFSRKYGIKYATQEQYEKDFGNVDGAYEGGSLKKLAKKKRKGFSGRGAGKALRGF